LIDCDLASLRLCILIGARFQRRDAEAQRGFDQAADVGRRSAARDCLEADREIFESMNFGLPNQIAGASAGERLGFGSLEPAAVTSMASAVAELLRSAT